MNRQLFTVAETADILRRHPETVRRMVKRGELGGQIRHGGGWVTRRSIEDLLGEPIEAPGEGIEAVEDPYPLGEER